MNLNRRNFLKQSGQGALGLFGAGWINGQEIEKKPLPKVTGEIDPHDEKFWNQVREQFPLTRERIYFNNGGLGPSPYSVIEAVYQKTLGLEKISESGHSEKLWHSIKDKAAAILGCEAREIAFTRNATEGINIVCNGLTLKPGDEIITTTHEHVGNTITWLARQKRDGIVIKTFEPSIDSSHENLQRINELVTAKTRVISIPHVTTSTGQILPVEEISGIAVKHDITYFIDGAQAPGMMPVNVRKIGCDAYATSGHKWLLGPKGTGLLYVRKDMLDRIQPKWVGAYSNSGPFDMATGNFEFHPSAQRYEYGTVSTPLAVGLAAALDFLMNIGLENIWRHNKALANYALKGLKEAGAEVLSPENPLQHSAMITFKLKNVERNRLQSFLAKEHKIRARGIYEGGLDGVRVCFHIYNSFEEIDHLLRGINTIK